MFAKVRWSHLIASALVLAAATPAPADDTFVEQGVVVKPLPKWKQRQLERKLLRHPGNKVVIEGSPTVAPSAEAMAGVKSRRALAAALRRPPRPAQRGRRRSRGRRPLADDRRAAATVVSTPKHGARPRRPAGHAGLGRGHARRPGRAVPRSSRRPRGNPAARTRSTSRNSTRNARPPPGSCRRPPRRSRRPSSRSPGGPASPCRCPPGRRLRSRSRPPRRRSRPGRPRPPRRRRPPRPSRRPPREPTLEPPAAPKPA